MFNTRLFFEISRAGFVLSALVTLLFIFSVIFMNSNMAGLNFRYGFNIPVSMVTNVKTTNADTSSIKLKAAKPFTLATMACPSAREDLDLVEGNVSGLKVQNRLPMANTELKVISESNGINIWLMLYNLTPYVFWIVLFYILKEGFKAGSTSYGTKRPLHISVMKAGIIILIYPVLLFLFSLTLRWTFGGAAYIDANESDYMIHFHPRLVFNFAALLTGLFLIGLSRLIYQQQAAKEN